jgi:hypothetical protein
MMDGRTDDTLGSMGEKVKRWAQSLSDVLSEEVLRRLFVVELFKFGVLYMYRDSLGLRSTST